jgi:cytochrome c
MRLALVIATFLAQPLAAQEFFTLKGHGGPIMDIAVSRSGQVATASFDNSVGVWDGQTPTWKEGHRAAVNAVRYGRSGFQVSGGDDNMVRFWQPDGESIRIGQHQAKVIDVAVSEQANLIASASWDHTIGLWKSAGGAGDVLYPAADQTGQFLKGHRQGVNAIAFTQDGKTLYSASVDGTIRSWNPHDTLKPSTVVVKHGFGINELIVADTWLAYGATDGGTRMIDLASGEQIADFTLERRPILSMAYSSKTKQLAVGDGQGYIMLIDTEQRKITHDFRASQSGPIWALAYSPDGQTIYAGGIEDIVYAWPVATMTEHEPMAGGKRTFLEDPESLPNGERQFKRKCSICHTLTTGSARKAGPSLHGLFGRRAGAVADYTYSDTLNGSDIVWTADTINALFDEGPDHYIPGTKMPMQRIVKQQDRDDLIQYLRRETGQGEN